MPLMNVGTPTLKSLRNYAEHEVINGIFSSAVVPLNKGTVVTIAVASGSPNVNGTGTGIAPTPFLSNGPSYGGVPSYATANFVGVFGNQVRPANTGDVPLGITLVDVAEVNKFGESYASRPDYERYEQQVVLSGEAVKILTRGWVKTNGFSGVPTAGSGAIASNGFLVTVPYNKVTYPNLCGKWLSPADNDGFALFKLEL